RAGKVRYIGASNYPAWRLMEALAVSDKRGYARFETYQPEYSLLERQLFEYEAKPFCTHYGLGVIPYSPLAGGFLTGKYRKDAPKPESARADGALSRYGNERAWDLLSAMDQIAAAHNANVAQVALAWMLSHKVMTAPIIGANNPEQLADLLPATEITLSAEEIDRLNDLTKWVRNSRPIWD
ncbi:MAG: aldo/keto reductase, partial [Fibrella sp.]|nr:aldo/keto reductase [Armatimonadota bacterium]